jgi:hypothetical protein
MGEDSSCLVGLHGEHSLVSLRDKIEKLVELPEVSNLRMEKVLNKRK